LHANDVSDPDGDSLSYFWFHYPEASAASVYALVFNPENANRIDVKAPPVKAPTELHIILSVTDKGAPPLTRYKRCIVNVVPLM